MTNTISVEELGAELRNRRKHKELSLRAVEEATGVSAATLSRLERGEGTPDLDVVERVAKWLGVAVQTATSGAKPPAPGSDEELKNTIAVHLRANKKISSTLARSIAETFDLVMKLELEKAKNKP